MLHLAALAQSAQPGIGNAAGSGAPNSGKPVSRPIGIVRINDGSQESRLPSASASDTLQVGGPTGDAILTGNQIEYHNGSIFQSTPNVYLIWYGNWSNNTATTIVPQFISDLNHTQYFNINTTYGTELTDPSGSGAIFYQSNMVNTIAFGGQIFDSYSQGTTLTDSSMQAVVNRALSNGLPANGNGIYVVLPSSDVNVTSQSIGGSYCTTFCGYHTLAQLHSTSIKYGFVGDPVSCGPCRSGLLGPGPNGNVGADGMTNSLAHEIAETVTNPDIQTGWYHINGMGEVGDKCNFDFGTNLHTLPNGAKYNVTFNGRNYLIQQLWQNTGGGRCSLAYSTPNGTPAVGKVAVTGAAGCTADGGCDEGTIQMQLIMPSRTVTETIFYDGSGLNGPGDAQGVANALTSAFNSDPNANSLVTASVVLGNPYWAPSYNTVWWINFTTKQNGASLNANQWSISINSFTGIAGTLSLTPTVSSMVGGADSCCSN
jgi:hypothetical protein